MNSIEYNSKKFNPDLSIEENFCNLKLALVSSEKGVYKAPNITRQTVFFRNRDLEESATQQQIFDAKTCIDLFKENNPEVYAEIHTVEVKDKTLLCVEILETNAPRL